MMLAGPPKAEGNPIIMLKGNKIIVKFVIIINKECRKYYYKLSIFLHKDIN